MATPAKHFIREIRQLSTAANLQFRTYQAYATHEAFKTLGLGNLVLTLPQGTGKTFVSQLIAYQFLRTNPRTKVLVIAPTKELRQQYVRMAAWMGELSPRLVVLEFKEPLSSIRKQVSRMVEAADVVVTTPEMFTNRLQWLSASSFKSIRLCVLDEIDLWLIDDYTDPQIDRYHASISELKTRLKDQGTHFLGLTASALSRRGRALLIDDLKCEELAPFHPSIVKWLPKVQIELVGCLDATVVAKDDEISERSKDLWRKLNAETNGDLQNHDDDFWPFVKALSAGAMGPSAAALALALLDNERQRLQLFEDVPLGKEKVKKAAKLARRLTPSIVYCREIQLVKRLAAEPWRRPPAVAHSDLGDRYLTETLRFKSGDIDVLLMTRDLGKRGLDFPFAKSLTLLSPKSSPLVMDQELCRTRGQRRNRRAKIVYVLFYRETYEEEKMRRVLRKLVDIRLYDRFPKFVLSRTWSKWLRKRPGLKHCRLPLVLRRTSALLAAAKATHPKTYALALLMRYSGLRISDATMLRVDQLEKNRLSLRTHKAQKDISVLLPDAVVDALRAFEPTSKGYFFWNGTTSLKAVTNLYRDHYFAPVFKCANLSGNPHPHQFRHTLAIKLLSNGTSVENVAALLGNTPKIVWRHYAAWVKERQEALDQAVLKANGFHDLTPAKPQSRKAAGQNLNRRRTNPVQKINPSEKHRKRQIKR